MKLSFSAQRGAFLGLGLVTRILSRRPVGIPAGDLCLLLWFGLMFWGCRGACVRLLSAARARGTGAG